jgi:hypothetical protein
MVEWFKHDFKARTHPRLQRIQMRWGMEGIGLYWSVIEMLYEQNGVLMLSECDAYAFALRTDSERLATFMRESGAFIIDGDVVISDTVNERIKERGDKSEKASISAKKRWNDANAMRTHSDGNAIREEKRREEKNREEKKREDKTVQRKRFTAPSFEQVYSVMLNRRETELFLAYYESNGWKVGKNPMKDWARAVTGWKLRGNVQPDSARAQYENYGDSIG